MKKIILIALIGTLMTFLISCDNYQKTEYFFGEYQVYHQSHGLCEMYIRTIIYEDNLHTYYLFDSGCSVGDYYYIRYNGRFLGISQAINEDIISIEEVIDSEITALVIEDK